MAKYSGFAPLIITIFASIFHIIGVATPNWYKKQMSSVYGNTTEKCGLWQYCVEDSTSSSCGPIQDHNDTSKYTYKKLKT